jgi:cytochrome b involved in lipid metabolism
MAPLLLTCCRGKTLRVAISDEWYDLTNWASHHPGGTLCRVNCSVGRSRDFDYVPITCLGEEILQRFNGYDATEAFYSLHSQDAIKRLKAMRPLESKEVAPAPHKLDVGTP